MPVCEKVVRLRNFRSRKRLIVPQNDAIVYDYLRFVCIGVS